MVLPPRCCPYCQQAFQPSPRRPDQVVCSQPDCQARRRNEYRLRKRQTDPVYAEVVRDSRRKWRDAHPDYQKKYWQNHADAAARNRLQQRQRDQKRRVSQLVKNTLVVDLKRSAAEVWLVGRLAEELVKKHPGCFEAADSAGSVHGCSSRDRVLKRTSSWLFVAAAFTKELAMLSPEQINEIHCLHFVEKWSQRRIARHLNIGRHTLAKYLLTPAPLPSRRDRTSKLDEFKPALTELLERDSQAPASVLLQHLRTLGYDGGITIRKDYLQAMRKNTALRRAYVRIEPAAGERFDIDWGHFGALLYNGTPRKLYAFCLVECHSRKMYLEFTHSQSFETFVRCHIHAFEMLGGCARELWFDNLATAVAEHEGNLVRFNPRFLAFARECGFIPRACHVRAAWEKGKVERAIGYVRQNFWPLRSFADLSDVNLQARRWLEETANRRKHRETGQAPDNRPTRSAAAVANLDAGLPRQHRGSGT